MSSTEEIAAFNNSILLFLSFYIQIPICLIGFCLNVVNVIVFYKNIHHSSLYFLVSSLALADAVTLILRASQGLLGKECWPLCSSPQLRMYVYMFVIFLEFPVTNITETISNWLTLSLAIERFLAMKHHSFSKVYCTLKNFKILTSFICIIALIINLPYFFTYNVILKKEYNNDSQMYEKAIYTNESYFSLSQIYEVHSWIRQVIVQFLPLLLLCVFNFLLFQIVYNHNRKLFVTPRCGTNSIIIDSTKESQRLISKPSLSKHPIKEKSTAIEKKLRAQKKLTILLITVILLFLIGQIPHSFAYIKIYKAVSKYSKFDPEGFEYRMFRTSTMVLTLLCYSLNFFIYLFLNTHFRHSVCCVNNQSKVSANKNGMEFKMKHQKLQEKENTVQQVL